MAGVSADLFASGVTAAVPVIAPRRKSYWTYEEAFKRNRGLISDEEQVKLRNSRVAIAGMGGVGGVHLITLARLGIGKFKIADPDVFEVANFNRQYGATISNLGRNKAEAMAEAALDINPELEIEVVKDRISSENVESFLAGADFVVDGLDLFVMNVRRLLFRYAAAQHVYALTAGPLGFGVAWLTFDPNGISFDNYFDLNDDQSALDQLIAFAVGLAPKPTHQKYLDLRYFNFKDECGPSCTISCQMSAAIVGEECVRILLHRPGIRCAPNYQRFDPYTGGFATSRLVMGNRNPIQKVKRWYLKRFAENMLNNRQEMGV